MAAIQTALSFIKKSKPISPTSTGGVFIHLSPLKQMNFTNDEKDVLFLSLNAIIKDYEVWNRLETSDKYHFLTTYKKLSKDSNSQFNIRYKLLDILKDYDEEYIWTAAFIVKPIVESQEFEQAIKEEK